MTVKKFEAKMRLIKERLSSFMNNEAVKKAGDKVFLEYLADKNEIPRKFVEEFVPYTHFDVVTVRDVLDEDFDRACRESERIIKRCEENGMIFLGHEGLLAHYTSLEIYWERAENFLDLVSHEIKTEDDRYRLFKSWFYSHAVCSYMDGGRLIPFLPNKTFMAIQRSAPEFWERLCADGKAYYEKEGYYEAKARLKEVTEWKKSQIRSLGKNELYKSVALEKDGRRVKIVA